MPTPHYKMQTGQTHAGVVLHPIRAELLAGMHNKMAARNTFRGEPPLA